jgi:hypothetical protein
MKAGSLILLVGFHSSYETHLNWSKILQSSKSENWLLLNLCVNILIIEGGKVIITGILTFPNNIQKNSLRAMRIKFPRIFKSKWEKESRGWRKCFMVSFIISAPQSIQLHDEMKKVEFGEG